MASSARLSALSKYFTALAPALTNTPPPSPRRKRIHLLYLINDLLHHTRTHAPDSGSLAAAFRPALPPLFAAAASVAGPRARAKLNALIDLWDTQGYYPASDLNSFRNANTPSHGEEQNQEKKSRTLLLPTTHGDPSIPYYDLPAGNWLPLIRPNSTEAINPRLLKPVQFSHVVPDKRVVEAVEQFLEGVEGLWRGDEGGEIDAVGGVPG